MSMDPVIAAYLVASSLFGAAVFAVGLRLKRRDERRAAGR